MEANISHNPPFLALDLGDRYIGLAFSEAGFLAKELETIDRKNVEDEKIFEQIESVIQNHEIQALVVGLPVNADGSENLQCLKIRQFMENFNVGASGHSPFIKDIIFTPEDFSSFDAKEERTRASQRTLFGEWPVISTPFS